MHSKYKFALFLIILVTVIIACSQVLYIPTFADSQNTGVSTDTLALGRKLYVNNCAGCHNLYQPERFTAKQWEKIIPEMQIKAKSNDSDIMIISKYLKARSKKD